MLTSLRKDKTNKEGQKKNKMQFNHFESHVTELRMIYIRVLRTPNFQSNYKKYICKEYGIKKIGQA